MQKIKVLHAIRQGLIGGGETHVLNLVSKLDPDLFESVVLSFTDGPMIERLQGMNVPCHVIASKRAFDVQQFRKVQSLLIKEKIDIVHAHGSRAASNLLWPARSLVIPILYTIHGWSFHNDQSILTRKLRIISEHFLTKRTSRNISVSVSNQESGRKHLSDFDSIVVNNGIDLEVFNPALEYQDMRESLGIPRECLLIVFLARMTTQKAPLILINAFNEVLKEFPSAHLLMVGEGELRQSAQLLAEKLKIIDHITFENFRKDVPAILKTTDIYCLPSLWEGLPIGLLEAMAMENAVIASEVDGSKEIISHEKNGLLIKPGSTETLANALLRLCRDDSLRTYIRQEARQTVEKRYNIIRMVQEIEEVYTSLHH